MEKISMLEKAIKKSEKIVFFGGAGVSTESGIPDFRSTDGIFMQETSIEHSPEEIISIDFFNKYPKQYFKFHFDKLVYPHAKPNIAHRFITKLEQQGKDVTVVTQNIDGLHQSAGNSKVLELHGNVQTNYCTHCKKVYQLEDISMDKDGIPRCLHDGHIIRPDIVMYGEALNSSVITEAITAIQNADMMIIAGTSLVVYPASTFVDFFNGETLAVINKTSLRTVRSDALIFEDYIGEVLNAIKL
ncbi:NAD-dependent protein deacylase [Macrococcoides caseolyticum]|uniref:NAD-dependent protein deacylase n=1 Tax=Macrococcoides caseolyticum TaxID=69966 RepID=UPI00105F31E2|nr:NAD-dependent protein deacylase [Macrococcus caseolyticus]TDM28095.1 NAD-dependent protein deacylase [Macrococcus caseolyticus]